MTVLRTSHLLFSNLGGDITPTYVAIPTGLCLVAWIVTRSIFEKVKDDVDERLRKSTHNVDRARLIAMLIEISLIGICIEAADFSSMVDGQLDVGSFVACCILPFGFAAFALTDLLSRYHQRQDVERFRSGTLAKLKTAVKAEELRRLMANDQYIVADRMREFLTALVESQNNKLTSFRSVLEKRLHDNLSSSGTRIQEISSSEFLKLLSPLTVEHASIVAITQQVFEVRKSRKNGKRNRVRVALFQRKGMHMEVVASFDGESEDVVVSPKKRRDHYKLSNLKDCLAVAAAFEHDVLVVKNADIGHADANRPFNYFTPTQRHHIKSIVGIPIQIDPDVNESARYVICADCDQLDYFDGDIREECDFIADNAKKRLALAVSIDDVYQCLFLSLDSRRK